MLDTSIAIPEAQPVGRMASRWAKRFVDRFASYVAGRCAMRTLAAGVLLAAALAGCATRPGAVKQITARGSAHVAVRMRDGVVIGRTGTVGTAFLGIPYAEPPVGARRWTAPVPPAPWTSARDAGKLAANCAQIFSPSTLAGGGGETVHGLVSGKEDCLYLNVYVPPVVVSGVEPTRSTPRPVMAWFHGGAYVVGSGADFDPSVLARKTGAIIVTFNYRLGVFGFFAHPGLRAAGAGSGNFALLDQQAALRWVADNIGAFGGDAGNVTAFGESAGAWAICSQLTAPAARGLFERAILESGSCTAPDSVTTVQEADAAGDVFAARAGCGDIATAGAAAGSAANAGAEEGADAGANAETNARATAKSTAASSASVAVSCLRDKSASALLHLRSTRRGINGPASWGPAYGDAILPRAPRTAFETGAFMRIPMLSGTNRDEGRLFAAFNRRARSVDGYRGLLAERFGAEAPAVLAHYPPSAYPKPALAYAAVLTDSLFACPSQTLRGLLARYTPVYAYEFNDPHAPINVPQWITRIPMGAFHSSELVYVFQTPWMMASPEHFDASQRGLAARIGQYWKNFAQSGRPDAEGENVFYWSPYRPGNEFVLALAPAGPAIASHFDEQHQCGFWKTYGY